MTNPRRTDITVLLDRSGSMSSCLEDTIGGFNTFVTQQQESTGDIRLTLVQFDDQYDVRFTAVPIDQVEPLTHRTYWPRGSTALLDAMAQSITETGDRLRALPESERPAHVIFVIVTDGYENSSRRTTRQQVFDQVAHQRDRYNWQFIYLGANQDAIAAAAQLAIPTSSAMSYHTGATSKLWDHVGATTSAVASGVLKQATFTDYMRADSMVPGGSIPNPGEPPTDEAPSED